MTESKDKMTGISRHEYSTVTPEEAHKQIRGLDGIVRKGMLGKDYIYTVKLKNQLMDIKLTETRLIIFGMNRLAMLELGKLLHPEIWEYDNTSERTDYIGGRK